jgi:ribosomal protein S18
VPYSSRRFKWEIENSRYYGASQIAWSAQMVSPVTYIPYGLGYAENFIEYVSPKFLPRYVSAFVKRIKPYNITGVSLRDLGDTLQSDRKRTELIDREHALSIVTAQLDSIAGLGKDIMVSGGNLYSLPMAHDLINVPLSHSDFFIVDAEVPFYQMVLHGYIPYSGYAINLSASSDTTADMLRMLEYGASPHFTLTYEQASEMKYTGLNRFYGTFYQNWTEAAIELYNTINPVLRRVSGSLITRHEATPEGLRCVTYDNGIQILVNYTGADIVYEGVTVPAQWFNVREGVPA